jgi:RNA polymerase sigma-70 factor (ECF subfamily)
MRSSTTCCKAEVLIEDLDHTLVRRAVDGDAEAFGELIARHRTSALRIATVVLGTPVGADDVVQDADLRAWRARAGIDPQRPFRSWYLRVVANAARNDRRSRGRRAALEIRETSRAPAEPVVDPAERVVTAEERQVVLAAINRLGAGDRLVIALRHFEQLGEHEMAEVLGCPAGTVKSRLARATSRLRDELAAAPPEVVG